MRRIAFLLIGITTVLAGCQTGPSNQTTPRNCTPRLEDAGICDNAYGTTFTIQTVSG
jgi:hypothetical protein